MTQNFIPRASQAEILKYRGGTLGISAVPGSGKTHILSALAAQIIGSGVLDSDQEVLIVTLVNSAVDNFSSRIGDFVSGMGLVPRIGYRVRTLHGLAHDIVRENPALVGLDNRFSIVDEREADSIRSDAANSWINSHHDDLELILESSLEISKRDWVKKKKLPELVNSLATAYIRTAKDNRLTPEALRTLLDSTHRLPLAELGWDIYANYQRALNYRGAVDFDDLIRLALDAISNSTELKERLQHRFPFILEDEAQDSSSLQEKILSKLSSGNWVRVGDPNQAIFETFTTARPEYLLEFIKKADKKQDLPVSGRSQPSIINLANRLIDWVNNEHPVEDCKYALTVPYIMPTERDDPQSNPENNPQGIYLIGTKYTPDEELQAIVKSIKNWLPLNKDKTVAVLVPSNRRGVEITALLKQNNIDYLEYLSSTSVTRAAAGALSIIITYLSDPSSSAKLAKVFHVWRRAWRNDAEKLELYNGLFNLIRKINHLEDFLAPSEDIRDYLSITDTLADDVADELNIFKEKIRRWHETVLLPIDQMILAIAQDIFTEPADLALSHKLAILLKQVGKDHPDWHLPELANELLVIAKNERKFLGFSDDDSGFNPEKYKGRVVVSTMHKAKGLEWDKVYLSSVNNYDFPSALDSDNFISEKWYAREGLNIEAETIAQLNNAIKNSEYSWQNEGEATISARIDYSRERLRLLYVGITRARLELVITWNTGRNGNQRQSLPFAALMAGYMLNSNANY
ncbi:MAG: ATP-dependent helicase [Chloroflexota bacterium]